MQDDDFVLTISDNEENIPDLEDQIIGSPSRPHGRSNEKRKLQAQKAGSNSGQHQRKKRKLTNGNDGDESELESQGHGEDEGRTPTDEDDGSMNSDFEFQAGDTTDGLVDDFDGWAVEPGQNGKQGDRTKHTVDIDEIIARRMRKEASDAADDDEGPSDDFSANEGSQGEGSDTFIGFDERDEYLASDAFGMGVESADEADDMANGHSPRSNSEEDQDGDSDQGSIAPPVPHPDDQASEDDEDDEEDPEEVRRRAAFFAPEDGANISSSQSKKLSESFQSMSLSRPILKGLAAVGFTEPTPIQSKTIPVALLGKDIVAGAVTGSGKTAAFIIPILERLLYRPRNIPTTRVAIIMPTRELAVQCFNVSKKLASFTDITFAQLVGGFSLREQEQILKTRPDVVIATPGRFIDHMRNSATFAVDTLEILVLDEADRMLDDGFADELTEILAAIPKSRQTMLFSATMTDSVDRLIRVGLNRPVRLMIDPKKQTVAGLVQEFVRLRPGREEKRLAYLMYLCENVYTDRVIIFFGQKREAHRVRVVFGLCGLKAAELHGSMSQEQRIQSVETFRSGRVSFLLATDLASRGLDIKNVSTVINYGTPQSHEIYLHRVGRTARAGRSGRACTIAAESDRKVVRAAVKAARAQGAKVQSRIVSNELADVWAERLASLDPEVEAVLAEEKTEKAMQDAERDVQRGENLVVHEAEIKARPKRTWFETEQEKRAAKEAGRLELNGPKEGGKKKEKRKLSGKDKKKLQDRDDRTDGKTWKKGAAERNSKAVKRPKSAARGKENRPKNTRSSKKPKRK